MKKVFLFLVLALLLTANTVFALECSQSPEPNAGGEERCVTSVYNNASADLDVGDVVIWDIEQSTGDNDNWVTTTTTNDTALVAGVVVGNTIAVGGSGVIVTRGVVQVDALASSLSVVDALACTSGTAGSARSCTTEANNFGFVTTANTGTSANVCVYCNK